MISFAKRSSAKSGIITARAMGVLGQDPPVFDILAWNADGTNLPAKLHTQFLSIFEGDLLPTPNAVEVLSTPIELQAIKVPPYVIGAINDHLTPWRACYATTQLLAGDSTFVLSNAGPRRELGEPARQPEGQLLRGTARPHRNTR